MGSFPQFARLPHEIQRLIITFAVTVNLQAPIYPISFSHSDHFDTANPPRFDIRGLSLDTINPRGIDTCCGTSNPAIASWLLRNTARTEPGPRCYCRYSHSLTGRARRAIWSPLCTCLDLCNGVFQLGGSIGRWAWEAYYGCNQFVVGGGCPWSVLVELTSHPIALGAIKSLVINLWRPPHAAYVCGRSCPFECDPARVAWKRILDYVKMRVVHPKAVVKIVFAGLGAEERSKNLHDFEREIEKKELRNVAIFLPSEKRWAVTDEDFARMECCSDCWKIHRDPIHDGMHWDGCERCKRVRYADHLVTVHGPPVTLQFAPDC